MANPAKADPDPAMTGMGVSEAVAPAGMDAREWALRLELAACYQLFDFMGWHESIFNHISLRVPGPDHHYLVNPFGLNYSEVTASNLIKVDVTGVNVDDSAWRGNPAAFAIHGAIHSARDDAQCVIHTHTTAAMAVACKRSGLRHDDFYGALLLGDVGYHDFEGITVRSDERDRLVGSLGRNNVLVLRNHGVLVTGSSLPHAFFRYWTLQRACEVQAAALAMDGADVILDAAVRQQSGRDAGAFDPAGTLPRMVFEAAVRRMTMMRERRFVDWRQ
jgi:ribulose-5-phosphate 4-epimerase/fuculose-1-phosphate aldolase